MVGLCTTIHQFLRAPRRISESRLWVLVGQVVRGALWVRRIVNPPAALGRAAATFGESSPFAACRYAGQVADLRGGWLPPPACNCWRSTSSWRSCSKTVKVAKSYAGRGARL